MTTKNIIAIVTLFTTITVTLGIYAATNMEVGLAQITLVCLGTVGGLVGFVTAYILINERLYQY